MGRFGGKKFTLLDGCCCAGVGADGYKAAGFDEIVGVDIDKYDYPYTFWQADVMDVLEELIRYGAVIGKTFDAAHFSFPCQLHTIAANLRDAQGGESRFDDLLTPGLELLDKLEIPWVVENVPGTRDIMRKYGEPIMLCGSMFGLRVQRHRLFLSNVPLVAPGPCDHSTFPIDKKSGKPRPIGVYHVPNDEVPSGGKTAKNVKQGRKAMGVTREVKWEELKEGIPPAYTEWLGRQLLAHLRG